MKKERNIFNLVMILLLVNPIFAIDSNNPEYELSEGLPGEMVQKTYITYVFGLYPMIIIDESEVCANSKIKNIIFPKMKIYHELISGLTLFMVNFLSIEIVCEI